MLHMDKVLEEIKEHSRRLQQNRQILEIEMDRALKLIEESEISDSFQIGTTGINSIRDAISFLNGRSVCGVDGSQIEPSRENRIPFGGVQVVALSVNHGDGSWRKDVKFKLTEWNEDISLQRFRLECNMAKKTMDGKKWVFFDGSLVLSFAGELRSILREAYIEAIKDLLRHSRESETPVVGVVDRSRARDIISFLSDISGYEFTQLVDSALCSRMLATGGFTYPFPCQRDILKSYGGMNVHFMYLNAGGEIIRIEFPEWMDDMAEEIAGITHSECFLGKTRRYPYILERAHFHAVIRERERLEFYRIIGGYFPVSKTFGKVMR